MNKKLAAAVLLISAVAIAMGSGARTRIVPPSSNGALTANNTQQCTTADVTLYVDKAGNDSNACTDQGVSACLTPQAALNKAPHCLRHQLTISIDAGSFPGFVISGFAADTAQQTATGGLLITGAPLIAASPLDGGSATGTAASGTAGTIFGTLTAGNTGAANWVTGDLVGHLITTANPTNNALVIIANDAGTLTVGKTWSAPTGSTTFTIQDPATLITTAASLAATPLSAATANRAGIIVAGNTMGWRQDATTISALRLAPSVGAGLELMDGTSITIQTAEVRPGSASADGVRMATLLAIPGVPQLTLNHVAIVLNSASSGLNLTSGGLSATDTLLQNLQAGVAGITNNSSNPAVGIRGSFGGSILGFTNGVNLSGASRLSLSGAHVECSSGSGTVAQVGNTATSTIGNNAQLIAATTDVATCGTGIQVIGPSSAAVTSLTGTVGTTAFDARNGGIIQYSAATTITGTVQDIAIDASAKTSSLAGVAAGNCLANAVSGSMVCNGATTALILPVRAVPSDGGTPNVAIEYGRDVMATGTKTVVFKNAFSIAPACFCQDGTAINACDVPISTISTTQAVVNGTTSDTFSWMCIGDR